MCDSLFMCQISRAYDSYWRKFYRNLNMSTYVASKNKIHKKELWAYGTLTFLAQDVEDTNLVRPLWQYDG